MAPSMGRLRPNLSNFVVITSRLRYELREILLTIFEKSIISFKFISIKLRLEKINQ